MTRMYLPAGDVSGNCALHVSTVVGRISDDQSSGYGLRIVLQRRTMRPLQGSHRAERCRLRLRVVHFR